MTPAPPSIQVRFQPQKRTVHVAAGTLIIEAAARAGITIPTPCGGAGTCGKCRVQVSTDVPGADNARPSPSQAQATPAAWVQACQATISSACTITIPEQVLLQDLHQIVVDASSGRKTDLHPAVRKRYVELPEPTLADPAATLMRLERAVGPCRMTLAQLQALSRTLAQQARRGTVVLIDESFTAFEAGDTTAANYGIAFDIGTTTLVGALMNLHDGSELAICSRLNPQVSRGDDVLSRIQHAATGPDALNELQARVLQALAEMIHDLCARAGIASDQIYEVVLAGNTTMEHLLCGIDPAPLGQIPFVPVFNKGLSLDVAELPLPIHPRARLYVFPLIGGFVGGDTVAAMLTTDLSAQDKPVLMIDVGTNGEIVLSHAGHLWAASTAAGPAFEGARIQHGMRAAVGAIEKVLFDDDIRTDVIGGGAARGFCGSALIDLLAGMLNTGMVSLTGKLLPPAELPTTLAPALRRRVTVNDQGRTEFRVTDIQPDDAHPPVVLTEKDVRELQLAVGAIRAGITLLLRQAGLTPSDLDRVLVAGGFGSFIRRSHAQRIGLLPADIEHHRIRYIGNAALAGARRALLSTRSRTQGEVLARQTEHVELSLDRGFQQEFAEAMIFPE